MNILNRISTQIQKSAEMVSEIIEIDVEVMDYELNRIVGTGTLKSKIGINMHNESHIYRKVLNDGKSRIIFNPRDDKECFNCFKLKECSEKLEISMPIIFKNKIIGVIGLICFTENQKNHFVKNNESFTTFLNQFSLYISTKVGEYLENNEHQSISHFYLENFNNDKFFFISPVMKSLYQRLLKISKTSSNVLLTGESGTGKEIIAKTIYLNSKLEKNKFISINCGAIPEQLFESEMFGYVKGAFTGANSTGRIGKVQQANNGILFLDEIGDLPLNLQVKLLRVLQEKKFNPVGSDEEIEVNIRVIAATNKNLEDLIAQGKFREDLYYRLCVVPIDIPPLRNRKEDIKILTKYFIEKYCKKFNKDICEISKDSLEILLNYRWPGNIRELENAIEYALNTVENNENIRMENLPYKIIVNSVKNENMLNNNLDRIERFNYKDLTTSEKKELAKKLGISLATLYRKINMGGEL